MNDFGMSLKGVQGIVKKNKFNTGPSEKDRTFVCESGIGCDPTPNTRRTVKGHWLSDKATDTINSYDFEAIIVDGEKVKAPITEFHGAGTVDKHLHPKLKEEPEPVVEIEKKLVPKTVRRKR